MPSEQAPKDESKPKMAASNIRRSSINFKQPKRNYGSLPPRIKTLTNSNWHWAMKSDICDLVQDEFEMFLDRKGRPIEPKPVNSRKVAFNLLAERYLRYIMSYKTFDECYKFMVHPQKRLLVVNCIEGLLARILELKKEMVDIEQREFHFFDDILQTLSLTPDQVEIHIPELFSEFRAVSFRNRELILDTILQRMKRPTAVSLHGNKTELFDGIADVGYTREEAILLIQRNERAFQARKKRKEMMRPYINRMFMERSKMTGCSVLLIMSGLRNKYVGKWRAYVTKRKTERRRHREMVFLGMIPSDPQPVAGWTNINEQLFKKKQKAVEFEENYLNERAILKERMLESDGPGLAEDLRYNIRQWLLETRDLMGKFPAFPDEDKGGSSLLFSNKTVAEVEEDIREMLENKGKKVKGKKKKGKKEKKKKKKKDKKKSKTGEEGFTWIMPKSKSLPILRQVAEDYSEYWYYRDEGDNIEQRHDQMLMKEEARLEVAEQIRREVDNAIRQELERLTIAVDRTKKKKKESKAKKKSRKGGKKKKKKGKDLTADKTIEELYEQLVMQDIIKKSERIHISDFVGSLSFIGCALQESGQHPMPSLADVRHQIIERIIFPLGSSVVHQRSPLNRSFVIAGPRESGKHMLLQAICHETGANLFDLTPANLVGKYDDANGRKMLMHLIMKVGKALEPSIFVIDNCESLFLKKKVKGDTVKAHKWANTLRKTVKHYCFILIGGSQCVAIKTNIHDEHLATKFRASLLDLCEADILERIVSAVTTEFKKIKNGDRMMLIGLTNKPYLAKIRPMSKCFNNTVLVPRPDYGNRRVLWQHFIAKFSGAPTFPDIDVSNLTKVSSGYSAGSVKQACMEVLTARRVEAIHRGFQLRTVEFVRRLATSDPIYLEEEQALWDWYAKTPLAKKRMKWLSLAEPTKQRTKGTGKKGKKGGKKKKK